MDYEQIIKYLESISDPDAASGMARYGIKSKLVYGVSIPNLRKMAKEIGKDHNLALKLWDHGARETMVLASMVDEPGKVTEEQMEDWVKGFDNWEVCDQCCMNLFEKTPYAYKKCLDWSSRKEEFVKRAGFVMMARLAVSDKEAGDEKFRDFFPIIKKGSTDERNFVKKSVNWALRQLGKRNGKLNAEAIETAKRIYEIDSRSARWTASHAIRELESEPVQNRLKKIKR